MEKPAPDIRLINLDDTTIDLIRSDLAAFESLHAVSAGNHPALVRESAELFLRFLGRLGDLARWGAYLVADAETGVIVGNGGFKGPPSDGVVEIGYSTFEGFEGRGYATAVARELLEIARSAPEVRQVIAHTLPEENASAHILHKIGMAFRGEVTDPVDGLVWRWEEKIR